MKNRRFGQKLHLVRGHYNVSAFRSTFRQNVPHFAKKHEKSSIWPKLATLSSRLPCFGFSVNFSAKSCKKCLISRKRTKNRRFGQNLQLFEQTVIFRRLGELFAKKCQKVPHLVKKHENLQLVTFRGNCDALASW